jgi:hypothetical protein
MRRVLVLVSLLTLVGCRAAAERAVLQPLPDDSGPMPFSDLVGRARLQAMTAHEAFYVDNWADVEEAARGLEQTSRFLKRATAVPANLQASLSLRADNLGKDAAQLREAAKARNVDRINATLQRLHMQIRELR